MRKLQREFQLAHQAGKFVLKLRFNCVQNTFTRRSPLRTNTCHCQYRTPHYTVQTGYRTATCHNYALGHNHKQPGMCLGWQLPALHTCMRSAGSRVLLKSPVQKFTPQSSLKDTERVYLIGPRNTLGAFYSLYLIPLRASDLITSSFPSPHLTKLAVQGPKCLNTTLSLFTQL